MRYALKILVPALSIVVMAFAACGSDAPSDKQVLISLTDQVVLPAYQAVSESTSQLDGDGETLCDSPNTASLEAARESWRDARESWMFSGAVSFGPVMDRRSLSLLDWSPTDVSAIDHLLFEGPPVSIEEARNVLASNQRGFGAIEYILFDSSALSNLESFPAHCAYLSALTQVIEEETAAILSEWMNGSDRPPYKDYFTDRADIALIPKDGVSEVVRTQVFLIRNMVDMRLASALGLREGGLDLSLIPGNAADNGIQDLRNELLGMQAVYEGSGEQGLGLSGLVSPLSKDTDRRLRDQFATAIAAIDAVEDPIAHCSSRTPRPDPHCL